MTGGSFWAFGCCAPAGGWLCGGGVCCVWSAGCGAVPAPGFTWSARLPSPAGAGASGTFWTAAVCCCGCCCGAAPNRKKETANARAPCVTRGPPTTYRPQSALFQTIRGLATPELATPGLTFGLGKPSNRVDGEASFSSCVLDSGGGGAAAERGFCLRADHTLGGCSACGRVSQHPAAEPE